MAGVSNVNTNLTVAQPNQMSISDMLTMARGAQSYQQAGELNPLLIQEAQQKIRSATAEANVAEETQAPKISKAKTEAESALVNLSSAQVDNLKKHSTLVTQGIQALMTKPDLTNDDIINAATELNANVGGDEKSLKNSLQGIPTGADGKPASPLELKSFLAKKLASTLDTQAQLDKLYPAPAMQNVGSGTQPVAPGNPLLTGVAAGTPQGEFIANKLPVGTEGVAEPNNAFGFPVGTYYKIDANGKPVIITKLSQSYEDKRNIVAEDYKNVQQQASGAESTIGILQDLKEVGRKAATGAGADREAFAIKVASALGLKVDPKTMDKAAYTDLFNKESNMLSNMPGMTDAARAISVMSNPNNKMDIRAIEKASDLLIARNKMILLEQGVKSKLQNNPDAYLDVKEKLDRIKDPRAIAFMSMPSQDQKNIWNGLAVDSNGRAAPKGKDGLTSEQREFKNKVDSLRALDNQYNLGLTK